MGVWKPSSAVFVGGTEAAKALVKRKVRTRRAVVAMRFDPVNHTRRTASIEAGAVGFVANPDGISTRILIAFASSNVPAPASLDVLMRQKDSLVVSIDWNEFRTDFEIEL